MKKFNTFINENKLGFILLSLLVKNYNHFQIIQL